MAGRGEVLLTLVSILGVGLILVLNNLPPSAPRRLFSINNLKRTLDQIQATNPVDGPSADLSIPGCEDYYNFSLLDDSIVLRLDSLGDDSQKRRLAFEHEAEELGFVAEWPNEHEFGLEKSIAVRLGGDTSRAAASAAQIMDTISGIRGGSPITVSTTGFNAEWKEDA